MIVVLRWILCLPCALLTSFVSWYLVVTLNRITMQRYVAPESFSGKVYLHTIGSVVVGVVFVYVSAFVAPSHKRQVAVIVAGLAVLLSGALIFASFVGQNYWAVSSNVFMDVGALGMAYAVFTGETKPTLDGQR